MKKAFRIIKKIINILLVIFVLLFLLMVCLQRFTNNEISFFNYRMFTVASGSMAPEYEVGDVLIAKETPPEKIKVGDSITYVGQQGSFAGKIVTHSVTRIEKDKNGDYVFHTKGIANLVEDPPVYQKQVYGVIVWKPIIMSFIYKIINTKYGLFLFVVLPIFYIFGSELLSTMLEKEEKRRAKLQEKKKEDNEDKENKEEKEPTKEENIKEETSNEEKQDEEKQDEDVKEENKEEQAEEDKNEDSKEEKEDSKEDKEEEIKNESKEDKEVKEVKENITQNKNNKKNNSSKKKNKKKK